MRRAFWNRPKKIKKPSLESVGDFEVQNKHAPIHFNLCAMLGMNPEILITYGKTIYNIHAVRIEPEMLVHEKVHMEQQNNNDEDAALWWGKYLRDPKFRVEQEAQAYTGQYCYVSSIIQDRERLFRYMFDLAGVLSGPLYKNSISQFDALRLIKSFIQEV